MPSFRGRIGRSAEIAAAAEMGRLGYVILASNYHCRAGEIDFVARDGDIIAFVEVRCKRTTSYGPPAESITPAKQRKIGAAAQHYLLANGITDTPCRFDVVEVVSEFGKLAVKEIIKDAFWL